MQQITLGELIFEVLDEQPTATPARPATAESEPPVLLLHGFPQDLTSWDFLAIGLHRSGYRTIRPNLRGYSPRARPRSVGDYRLHCLVGDVVGLLDALAIPRCHVVGHDWGGGLAWALGCEVPTRVATVTVLSTPHPAALLRMALRSDQWLRSWYMAAFQVPGLAERLLRPSGPAWRAIMRGLPGDAQQHYTRRADEPGALTAMLAWYRAMARDLLSGSVAWQPIHQPTLYCWGARDPALGAAAAHATHRFVTGPYTFLVLPNHGHWLPERASASILPALLKHLSPVETPVETRAETPVETRRVAP